MSQVCNTNENKILDSKLIIESKYDFDNAGKNNLITVFLAIYAKKFWNKAKKDQQINYINKKTEKIL